MWQKSDIQRGKWYMAWNIVVPETRAHYSASYHGGYQGFNVGDSVRLIHKKKSYGLWDYSGFIVDIRECERGKVASVQGNDMYEAVSAGARR
jgi:hypothetical protein